MKKQPSGLIARKQERIRRLTEIYATGGYKTTRELAIRFGVTEQTILNNLKIAKRFVEDYFQETLAGDLDRRMLQLETLIEKGFRDHEISKSKKVWCRLCNGKGTTGKGEDRKECERCEGEGFRWEEKSGDSSHLKLVLETVKEICKLQGHYPEKETKKLFQEEIVAGRMLEGASPELAMQVRRTMILIEQSKNGQDNKEDVLDVESEETEEEE